MLTYLSALLPDTSWPFWPHFWLLSVSILASFAVAGGIIFESSEYSASTHRVAKWLVIGGVAVEAVCTVSLFVFDERISGEQQSKIIVLETTLSPRVVEQAKAGAVLAKFPDMKFIIFSNSDSEPQRAAAQIRFLLKAVAGWQKLSVSFPFPPPFFPGVVVHSGAVAGPERDSTREDSAAANALIEQLNLSGVETRPGAPLSFLGGHGIAILVGPRPLPQSLQKRFDSTRYGEALYDDP
jgi:hypothetical protein